MYRIAVLAEEETERNHYAAQMTQICGEAGIFPVLQQYSDQEHFFESVLREPPTHAVIVLSGVMGLNAAEHLRSLCPACRIFWCSDLNFSLQAFRLRADYFLLKPVSEASLQQGLRDWLASKERRTEGKR